MFYRGKKCLFYHFFMECHSIQFTTIAINVERGIVKILFKYRYFQDLLIDIDIDIDIFQNHHIDIDIFGIALSISIFSKMTISKSISIFLELPYRYGYQYRYFQKWPYWYWYRYFSKVSIYRQSICHIDISNRAKHHLCHNFRYYM